MNDDILVSISCTTYNHVAFIQNCLDGFLKQKCDFQFEILIHDDASTDGTIDIISEYQQKYPKLIKPIVQSENQWSQGKRGLNAKFNFSRAKGKYIAMCEGDDFWTDPYKLQKQIDILEADSTIVLCSSAYKDSNGEDKEFNEIKTNDVLIKEVRGFYFDYEFQSKHWLCKTLTLVFRNESEAFERQQRFIHARDIHLIYFLLQLGRGFYVRESLGQYNKHSGGLVSQKPKKELVRMSYEVYKELNENVNDQVIKRKYLGFCSIMFKHHQLTFRELFSSFRSVRDVYDVLFMLKSFIRG